MHACPKGHLMAEVAIQAERIGIGEGPWITVGGAIENPHACPRWETHARNLYLAGRVATQPLDRAFVAQGLVDHRVHQAAVLAYLAPQRRPVYEEVHHIAQEMGGGFRARDEQLHAKAHD